MKDIAGALAKMKKFGVRLWIQDNSTDYDFNETYIPQKPFVIVAHGLGTKYHAVSKLKAIADYVAPAVENDGVADAIEKFII